ncbi:MAG: hypothetical protein RSB93_01795 [Rikenellaceae bacterium]
MKTTNYYFNKFYGVLAFVLTSFILNACANKTDKIEDGKGIWNPIPSENPVNMTAEAKSKVIEIKYLTLMSPENSETDKVKIEEGRMVVENDWVTITAIIGSKSTIEVNVKENTSKKARIYNLAMRGMPGEGILQIIQSGN